MYDFSAKGRAGREERKWEMTGRGIFLERQMRKEWQRGKAERAGGGESDNVRGGGLVYLNSEL